MVLPPVSQIVFYALAVMVLLELVLDRVQLCRLLGSLFGGFVWTFFWSLLRSLGGCSLRRSGCSLRNLGSCSLQSFGCSRLCFGFDRLFLELAFSCQLIGP